MYFQDVTRSLCCLFGVILLSGLAISCSSVSEKPLGTRNWRKATQKVVNRYAPRANHHLRTYFDNAHVHFPPRKISLLAFKQERKVELWARDYDRWRFIKRYALTATSGGPGPKLHDHDAQIPEGIYRITELNPFSTWHLSMKLNYPNKYDLHHAKMNNRHNLGGNIFIHGNSLSVGCLAVGDHAIDELFILVAEVGKANTKIIIAPNDLRYSKAVTDLSKQPQWVGPLYRRIKSKLAAYKKI